MEGSLTHKDSMGTGETLGRGAVQFMTAGRGVTHSEHNHDKAAPLRFIQMWLTPRRSGLPPNYGSFAGDAAAHLNKCGPAPPRVACRHVAELQPALRAQIPASGGRRGRAVRRRGGCAD